MCVSVGSGTESDSDESVPELEEQDSTQATTQQAQVGQTARASASLHPAAAEQDSCWCWPLPPRDCHGSLLFSLLAACSSSRNR